MMIIEKLITIMKLYGKKELAWRSAMHFIKVEYKTGAIVLSGWIQIGVGSVGGKEQELKGFVGMAPKKSVLKTMKNYKT